MVTFEPLEVEQSYIPLLKALMCGINAVEAQGCGCMFTFCHAYLKMGVLLHKMAIVCKRRAMTVYRVLWVSADPVDVRNDTHQGTRSQAICSSNFLKWIWGVILIPFEKTWPVKKIHNFCPIFIKLGKNDYSWVDKGEFNNCENRFLSFFAHQPTPS